MGRSDGSQNGLRIIRASTTQSASRGRPNLNPNEDSVSARPAGTAPSATSSRTRFCSSLGSSSVVSITTSAAARSGASISRSVVTAASPPPDAAHGWGRVLSAMRRTSTSSPASRNTTCRPGNCAKVERRSCWRASTTATAGCARGSAAKASMRSTGRLSTHSTPARSSAESAVALPDPERPVSTHAVTRAP